jgi:hypothetical protein
VVWRELNNHWCRCARCRVKASRLLEKCHANFCVLTLRKKGTVGTSCTTADRLGGFACRCLMGGGPDASHREVASGNLI